jgi:pimeloyl-ACP methyl ester carboxylesterase
MDRTLLPRLAYRYLMTTGVFPREHGEWLWQILLDRDTDLYYESGFAILRFDARDRIGRLDIPIRSIIPTSDQLIPANHQRETARIAGADVVELEGARHEAVMTHPGEVTKAIAEFVTP